MLKILLVTKLTLETRQFFLKVYPESSVSLKTLHLITMSALRVSILDNEYVCSFDTVADSGWEWLTQPWKCNHSLPSLYLFFTTFTPHTSYTSTLTPPPPLWYLKSGDCSAWKGETSCQCDVCVPAVCCDDWPDRSTGRVLESTGEYRSGSVAP